MILTIGSIVMHLDNISSIIMIILFLPFYIVQYFGDFTPCGQCTQNARLLPQDIWYKFHMTTKPDWQRSQAEKKWKKKQLKALLKKRKNSSIEHAADIEDEIVEVGSKGDLESERKEAHQEWMVGIFVQFPLFLLVFFFVCDV